MSVPNTRHRAYSYIRFSTPQQASGRSLDRQKKASAHYEHTVAIGKGKPDILSTFEYVDNVLKEKNNN